MCRSYARAATEARKTRGEEISWQGVDHELFDALRGLRKQIATERGVPPYVIFSDATLRELARVRPTTLPNFSLIYRIGENKLNDLGPKFVRFIIDHCKTRNLSTDQSSTPPKLPEPVRVGGSRPNPEKSRAFEMFRQGATLEEVSQQIGRARSSVSEYLSDFILAERPASIGAWVSQATYDQVHQVMRQVGTERLKPIFIALNETVPYDQIRLVVAHLQTR